MNRTLLNTLIILGLLALSTTTAFASGFAIIEQSVSGLGNAFAGGAASAEDATTVYFNPAGMTLLEGQRLTAGAHVIAPSAKFTASSMPTNIGGAPIRDASGAPIASGSTTSDAGQTGVVPNLYYTNKISDKMSLGLGINAPFGLTTKYDKGWAGRYHAVESAVATININPSIAFQVTDQLSLAAGFNAQYLDVTLSSMVDGGLVNYSAGNPLGLAAGGAGALSTTAYDVFVENKADDWGFGYNLGALFQFSKGTRLGLSYRSEIDYEVSGDVKAEVPTTLTALSGLFAEQTIKGSITLPASASLSLYSQVNDRLALMSDLSWTGWSSFEQLTINFEGSGIAGQTSSTTTENWKDSMRYSIGASFKTTDALTLRTGLAYDETPIPDQYRTPRIPGEDRTWLSLGAGYQLSKSLNLDVAYAHLFVPNSTISKSAATPEDQARGTIQGEYKNSVDIASVQLSYSF